MPALAEELLLLALHDRKGTVVSPASIGLEYGLRGALLAELALAGRMWSSPEKRLAVSSAAPTGDLLLDAVLAKVAQAKRPHDARHWVGHLSFRPRGLKAQLLDRLVQAGILRREEKRFLWMFSYQTHPPEDARPEARLRDRLRSAALGGFTPDARTLTLIALVSVVGLVNEVFPKEERPYARRRIKELLKKGGALAGMQAEIVEAVKYHKQAAEAAVASGVIVATTGVLHSI